ncbi:hypothetical protein [Spiroplasma poulsonii]|uniref:hypothetical protein n=1 Tax=Spiroplasma poulsonii TaxID=2138 RepID=UPI001319C64A|nr:hypothetical protein [Spiroplasma poulsonii]
MLKVFSFLFPFWSSTLYKTKVIITIKNYNRLLALLVKKLQIFVKKILIEKYNFN